MIVAMNQNAPGRNPNKVITKLFEVLLPGMEDEVLPENEDAQKQLAYRLKHLAIEAPECRPYADAKDTASGVYEVKEGTLAWESVDHMSLTVEFTLDGSRRYNRFRSPWQFA